MAAEDTSQPACGAIRDMLGIPADVQRTIFNHGSLGGPRKTSSAFDGCRGGDRVEKMVSVELAGYGAAGSSAHHVPNASASLGSDACAEAAHKEACIMNECPCATSESGDANVRRKANKLSEFSLEGDSAHAWDEGVALHAGLLEPPPVSDHNFFHPLAEALRASGTGRAGGGTLGQSCPTTEIARGEKLFRTGASDSVRAIVDDDATPGQPSLHEWWCGASAAVLLLQACGACWLLLGQRAPRSGAASGQRPSKAVRPRLSRSRGAVALLLLLSFLPVVRAGSGEAGSGEAGSGEQGSVLWGVPPSLPPPSPPSHPLAYYTITTTPGEWPSEVSWDLRCGSPREDVLSSAPYAGLDECGLCPDFQTEYRVSLSPGVECELVMKDSYGDGWDGASWSGLGQEGLTVAGSKERKSFVVPFAPPPSAPSPPLISPQLSPAPLVPGEAVANTPQDVRDEINKAVDQGRNASVYIPPDVRLAFSSNVECSGDMHLSVRSSGEGATLDGKKSSNMFYLSSGCSLYLEALHFVDGVGDYGGAVRASGAGDIATKDVSFTGCEASESAARARCTRPTCGRRYVRRGSTRGSAPTTSNAPPWHRGADDQAQRMTPGKRSRASTIAAGRRAAPNHGGRAAAARNPRHNANRARPSTGKHTPRLGHSVPRARERGWLLAREESFRDPLQDHARIIPRPGGRRDCNQSSRAACRSLGRLGRRGGEQGTQL